VTLECPGFPGCWEGQSRRLARFGHPERKVGTIHDFILKCDIGILVRAQQSALEGQLYLVTELDGRKVLENRDRSQRPRKKLASRLPKYAV
jgi:hypothetical protein